MKKESVIIFFEKTTDTEGSHVGGKMLLPKLTPWPAVLDETVSYSIKTNILRERKRPVPLRGIAQIHCKELPEILHDQGFPKIGTFSFFVKEMESWPEIESADDFKVIYRNTPDNLCVLYDQPKIPKEYGMHLLPRRKMLFVRESQIDELNIFESRNRIGGDPDWIQEEAFLVCTKRFPEIEETEWVLLLQLDDISAETFYFFIPKNDLQKGETSRIWCLTQNT